MNFWLVLGGAGAMFAGASLPWVSIQSMFGKVSIPGMDAASPFPFEAHAAATCAVVLGLVAWRLNAALLPTVTGKLIGAAASVLTLATGLYAWRQLTSLGLDDVLSVGWGLVLCVFGAGAALVGISRHIFMSLRH